MSEYESRHPELTEYGWMVYQDDFNALSEIADRRWQEIQHLRERIAELESVTYCAYCGKEYPLDGDAEEIDDHIHNCKKHPLFKANQRFEAMVVALKIANMTCELWQDRCELAEQTAKVHWKLLKWTYPYLENWLLYLEENTAKDVDDLVELMGKMQKELEND